MTPPIKKASPAKKGAPSLSDLVNKDKAAGEEEILDSKTASEEEPNNTDDDSTDDGNTDEDKVDSSDDDRTDSDLIKPGSETVETGKPIDNQVGNPDGITFSGNKNVINKTPAELAAETPAESSERFGISDEIPDEVHNNPNVTATRNNKNFQIPGGTHLHPDVAKDNYNRNVGGRTEHGEVTYATSEHVYATESPVDDKGIKRDSLNPGDLA